MGQVKWQWLAMVGLLLVFTAATPVVGEQPQDATSSASTSEDSTDDNAAAGESAAEAEVDCPDGTCADQTCPDGTCPLITECATCDAADNSCPTCPLELPPLELSLATADDSGDASQIISGGVTATATPPLDPSQLLWQPAANVAEEEDEPTGVIVPMWTPNSDRFLLSDRQEDLSLAAQADTEDKGDGPGKVRQTAPKPKTTPSRAAQPKPEPKPDPPPATQLANPEPTLTTPKTLPDNEVLVDTTELTDTSAGQDASLMDFLNLPEPDTAIDGTPDIIPSEQFSARELADAEREQTLPGSIMQQPDGSLTQQVGVIATQGPKPGQEPTLSEVLKGEAEDPALGMQVPGINPWRSMAVVLVCLALIFVGVAASKKLRGPFKLGKRAIAVIESISLGTGRQITIVEMGGCALVLGVTPQSINLLDKVPLGLMNEAYSGTVNAIINRESKALPDDWAQRPIFSVPETAGPPPLAQPLGTSTYGPTGRRISVGELRRSRAGGHLDAAGLLRPPSGRLGSDRDTKAELIGRIRDQLDRLED